MIRKIYDLKNTRKGLLVEAKAAVEAGTMELYNTKMAEVTKLNDEIGALELLVAEEGKFENTDTKMLNLNTVVENNKTENRLQSQIDNARSGNDYTNAWAYAISNGVIMKDAMKNESLAPLRNALTIGGIPAGGADGGFLVPLEFDNMIHLKMKDNIRLADFFNVETVSGLQGWRAVETTATRKALPAIDELGTLPKDDQPKFEKVTYGLKKYGDRIVISNELIADNTAGLMQYLSSWFAPKVVMTENALLLALLGTLVPKTLTATKEIQGIKAAFNKELNTAHSRVAVLIANQDSYDFLDNLTDTTGKGLLVPNLADPDTYRFKNKPISFADNDLLPNSVVGADTFAPIYIGCMKAFATLFKRGALEFATTNVGGDSWATDSNEVRGIVRMDAQKVDIKAAIVKNVKIV